MKALSANRFSAASSRAAALWSWAVLRQTFVGWLIVGSSTGVHAQVLDRVRVGNEVRITTPSSPRSWTYGTLAAATPDSIGIQLDGRRLVFAADEVTRMQVRQGRPRSVIKTVIVSGVGGAALGVLFVEFLRALCFDECQPLTAGQWVVSVGAVALINTATWVTVTVAWNASRPWRDIDLSGADTDRSRSEPSALRIGIQLAL